MYRTCIFFFVLAACGGTPPARPASPPAPTGSPAAPADAQPFDVEAAVKFNLDRINAYRAEANVPPLVIDKALSASAAEGTRAFAGGGPPHGYFREHRQQIKESAGAGFVTETQGKQRSSEGGPVDQRIQTQIQRVLTGMMGEGGGGGHHDTIVNPNLRRIGISIAVVGERLFLTNDFAD